MFAIKELFLLNGKIDIILRKISETEIVQTTMGNLIVLSKCCERSQNKQEDYARMSLFDYYRVSFIATDTRICAQVSFIIT